MFLCFIDLLIFNFIPNSSILNLIFKNLDSSLLMKVIKFPEINQTKQVVSY